MDGGVRGRRRDPRLYDVDGWTDGGGGTPGFMMWMEGSDGGGGDLRLYDKDGEVRGEGGYPELYDVDSEVRQRRRGPRAL